MEPDLNYRACRNLVATMLHQALRGAAHGSGFTNRIEDAQWVDEKESAHWAELLGIKAWPPREDCYKRLRQEHQQRVNKAREVKALAATAN
jgi:hypothetical protein